VFQSRSLCQCCRQVRYHANQYQLKSIRCPTHDTGGALAIERDPGELSVQLVWNHLTRRPFDGMLRRMAALPLRLGRDGLRSKSVEIERKTKRCWRNRFRANRLVAHWCPRRGKSGLFWAFRESPADETMKSSQSAVIRVYSVGTQRAKWKSWIKVTNQVNRSGHFSDEHQADTRG
jgi:hypothetical protein